MNIKIGEMKSWIFLFIVVLAWASSFTLIKIGLEVTSPLIFATTRFLIASLVLLPVLPLIKGTIELRQATCKDWLKFILLGLIGVTLMNIFQFIGLAHTTAINGSIILNTNPIFISIFSLLFLHEKIKSRNAVGMFIALAGIVIIMTRGELSIMTFSLSTFLGDLLIIASAVCWAIYTVLGKSLLTRYNSVTVTIVNVLIGTIFLFLFSIITEDFKIIVNLSPLTWLIIIYLGLICSGLAYLLWYKSLEKLDAHKTGAFLFTMPVFTILIAALTLGEPITQYVIFGTSLVMLGTYLAESINS